MTLIFRGYTQHLCPDCGGRQGEAEDCGACDGTGDEWVEANVLLDHVALIKGLDRRAKEIHNDNRRAGWWTDLATNADLLETRSRGEMLMLCVTELDEAQDARELGARDDKLPERFGFHVELADCAIRLLDLIGAEQRRNGQSPLIIYSPLHGATSVERCYREMIAGGQANYGGRDLVWIIGALAKALDEGYRKNKIRLARYWLSVALFRIIALCAHEDIPLFGIIEEKMAFNRTRADHRIENRRKDGGKKC